MDEMIITAAEIAAQAHSGQVDKSGADYISHPARVAWYVNALGGGEEAMAVAWLHDVVEDTVVTLDDLREYGFPETVVEAVDALSHRDGETRQDYYVRVAANPLALLVKQADLQDNSDPQRLDRLPAKTRMRLIRKYRHAREALRLSAR